MVCFFSPPGLLVTFFRLLTVALRTNYFRYYWTDFHQMFRIDKHTGAHNQYDLLFAIAEGTLL